MERERSLIKLGKPFVLKGNFIYEFPSRKHAYILLTPLNPTFI